MTVDGIREALDALARHGAIRGDVLIASNRPGRRWIFTPAGHAERSFTTAQVRDFITGARAGLTAAAYATTPEDSTDDR